MRKPSKHELGKPPLIPQDKFLVGVTPSKAFGLKREERSMVEVTDGVWRLRPVMLCVMATEELTRPAARVAKEYQRRTHTSPSMIGDMMFPEKYNAQGHKIQGPKNGQGAALVAAKWLKQSEKLGYIEYYYNEIGSGRNRTWSRGWKITDEGIKAALEWRKHAVGIEWLKDREEYSKRRDEASARFRENLKRKEKRQ